MGFAHMFLFLYKHNLMCSIYTRDLPYSLFYFNITKQKNTENNHTNSLLCYYTLNIIYNKREHCRERKKTTKPNCSRYFNTHPSKAKTNS